MQSSAQLQYRNESRDFRVTTKTPDLISDSIGFLFLMKGGSVIMRCISTIATSEELKEIQRHDW